LHSQWLRFWCETGAVRGKAKYFLSIDIAPPAGAPLDPICTNGGPYNIILARCMKEIAYATITTDEDIQAEKQRKEQAISQKQVADAAAQIAANAAAQRAAAKEAVFAHASPGVKLVCVSVDDFIGGYLD
jgi:hypothetical protein